MSVICHQHDCFTRPCYCKFPLPQLHLCASLLRQSTETVSSSPLIYSISNWCCTPHTNLIGGNVSFWMGDALRIFTLWKLTLVTVISDKVDRLITHIVLGNFIHDIIIGIVLSLRIFRRLSVEYGLAWHGCWVPQLTFDVAMICAALRRNPVVSRCMDHPSCPIRPRQSILPNVSRQIRSSSCLGLLLHHYPFQYSWMARSAQYWGDCMHQRIVLL